MPGLGLLSAFKHEMHLLSEVTKIGKYRRCVGIESTTNAGIRSRFTSTIALSRDQKATRLIVIVTSAILCHSDGPVKGKEDDRN